MASRKSISAQTRFSVLSRDRFTCRYCSRSAPEVELQVDHVKAVANGGTNDLKNLVAACTDCNQGKSDKDVPILPPPASAAKASRHHPLIGFGLLSFKDGRVCEQGVITAVFGTPGSELAVVQFFEWMGGSETYCRLLPVQSLAFYEGGDFGVKTYRLFPTNQDRNDYYEWKRGEFEEGAQ